MATLSKNGVAAAAALAASDEKLAVSSAKVASSKQLQAGAARQAEQAIKAEAEADNYLERTIAELTREYVQLKSAVTDSIKATGQANEASVKAAAAKREEIERVKLLHQSTQQYLGPLDNMTKMFGTFGGVALGAAAALGIFEKTLELVDTNSDKLLDGVSAMERLAFAFKDSDSIKGLGEYIPVVGGLAEKLTRLGVTAYGFATNSAEKEREALESERQRVEKTKQRNAELALIDEEAKRASEQQKEADERNIANASKLAEIRKRDDEQAKKRAELRKQGIAEIASMEADLAAKSEAAEADRARKQDERIRKSAEIEAANAALSASLTIKINTSLDEIGLKNAERRAQILDANAKQEEAIAQGVGDAMADGFAAIVTGSQRADKALATMAIRVVQMVAQLKLAQAIASSSIGIGGIFGGALGIGLLGAIPALFSKKADGGFVTGGTPGRDSVPTLLTPGEYVVSLREQSNPRELQRTMRRIMGGQSSSDRAPASGVQRFADGGFVAPAAPGYASPSGKAMITNATIVLNTWENSSNNDLLRTAKRLLPVIRQLEREGA